MIEGDAEFEQTLGEVARMYRALAGLRQELLPRGAEHFAVLAEGPLEEIARMEADLARYSGRAEAEALGADLWLRLTGDGVGWPEAPSSVVSAYIDVVRKGVQAGAHWLLSNGFRSRPSQGCRRACDLFVTAMRGDHLQIGLRLPDHDESDTITDTIGDALRCYADVAAWVGSDEPPDRLALRVPERQFRALLLAEIQLLLPRRGGAVETVELSGRALEGSVVQLTQASQQRIDQAFDAASQERVECITGDLQQIDLGDCTFTLSNVMGRYEVSCQTAPELLDTISAALGRQVEVRGFRQMEGRPASRQAFQSQPLQVVQITILEEAAASAEAEEQPSSRLFGT